jgi:hypothetical protein
LNEKRLLRGMSQASLRRPSFSLHGASTPPLGAERMQNLIGAVFPLTLQAAMVIATTPDA